MVAMSRLLPLCMMMPMRTTFGIRLQKEMHRIIITGLLVLLEVANTKDIQVHRVITVDYHQVLVVSELTVGVEVFPLNNKGIEELNILIIWKNLRNQGLTKAQKIVSKIDRINRHYKNKIRLLVRMHNYMQKALIMQAHKFLKQHIKLCIIRNL